MPERATAASRSEKSAEAVVAAGCGRRAERVGGPRAVSLERAVHQKPASAGRNAGGRGEAEPEVVRDEARPARFETGGSGRDDLLAGARESGDGVETRQSQSRQCRGGWEVDCRDGGLPEDALAPDSGSVGGRQLPAAPVRRVQIPKRGGGMRELGIPTVTDRLIQQALLQVLQPIIDPTFSEHSYGFRPGRRARDAVLKAQRHVQEGYRVVVDVDLEKFFDRVNHDILTERLSRRIADKAVLRLVRHYLVAGIMDGGVVMERHEGTPQGGRCRRCWPMCCWTRWTGNWRREAIASCATPTTAMCTCAVAARANEC